MTTNERASLEELVKKARQGDDQALDALVRAIQDRIYGLAVRMLADVENARDATQEILIKVVTNLARFRGESSFNTWSYRVAVNHLLTARAAQREQFLSFDALGPIIDNGIAPPPEKQPDRALLVEEMRVTCTESMLLCLDRPHRLAYILGEIFEFDSIEAAAMLEVTPVVFRKRLSRSRQRLESFMQARCGVYDASKPCRCSRQLATNLDNGFIDPARLQFASHPRHDHTPAGQDTDEARELVDLLHVCKVYRSHPDYAAPGALAETIQTIVRGHGGN